MTPLITALVTAALIAALRAAQDAKAASVSVYVRPFRWLKIRNSRAGLAGRHRPAVLPALVRSWR